MKSRDYINLGIYTALFFIIIMAVIFATALSVFIYPFGVAIASIPGAIIYILMRIKVPKKGSILLSGVVIAAIEFLIGAGWPIALSLILGSIIAEIITSIRGYEKFYSITLGYSLLMTSFALGTYGPIIYMKDFIREITASNNTNQVFMDALEQYLDTRVLIIVLIASFILSILGCILARIILNKKFKKAGLI